MIDSAAYLDDIGAPDRQKQVARRSTYQQRDIATAAMFVTASVVLQSTESD